MNQGLITTDGKIDYVNATSLASISRRSKTWSERISGRRPGSRARPGCPRKSARASRGSPRREHQIAMPLNMPTGTNL